MIELRALRILHHGIEFALRGDHRLTLGQVVFQLVRHLDVSECVRSVQKVHMLLEGGSAEYWCSFSPPIVSLAMDSFQLNSVFDAQHE